MNTIAFGLIVLSILMHSLWHFLCKSSGKSSMAFFALFSTSLFLTMLPFALCSGLLPALPFHVVKFAIGGALSGAVCNVGLMLAYKYCDISLAYPMARALPVFLTMVATVAFGWGKPLSAFAIVGMIVIFSLEFVKQSPVGEAYELALLVNARVEVGEHVDELVKLGVILAYVINVRDRLASDELCEIFSSSVAVKLYIVYVHSGHRLWLESESSDQDYRDEYQ